MLIHTLTQKCLTSKAHHISFSILLKTKAMVGESRRSDNGGEAERKDNNDTGNLINILIVTKCVQILYGINFTKLIFRI